MHKKIQNILHYFLELYRHKMEQKKRENSSYSSIQPLDCGYDPDTGSNPEGNHLLYAASQRQNNYFRAYCHQLNRLKQAKQSDQLWQIGEELCFNRTMSVACSCPCQSIFLVKKKPQERDYPSIFLPIGKNL